MSIGKTCTLINLKVINLYRSWSSYYVVGLTIVVVNGLTSASSCILCDRWTLCNRHICPLTDNAVPHRVVCSFVLWIESWSDWLFCVDCGIAMCYKCRHTHTHTQDQFYYLNETFIYCAGINHGNRPDQHPWSSWSETEQPCGHTPLKGVLIGH